MKIELEISDWMLAKLRKVLAQQIDVPKDVAIAMNATNATVINEVLHWAGVLLDERGKKVAEWNRQNADSEQIENGERCAFCYALLYEEYGRPIVCEKCGGDAVRAEDVEAEIGDAVRAKDVEERSHD